MSQTANERAACILLAMKDPRLNRLEVTIEWGYTSACAGDSERSHTRKPYAPRPSLRSFPSSQIRYFCGRTPGPIGPVSGGVVYTAQCTSKSEMPSTAAKAKRKAQRTARKESTQHARGPAVNAPTHILALQHIPHKGSQHRSKSENTDTGRVSTQLLK